jgi:hypothetical protein
MSRIVQIMLLRLGIMSSRKPITRVLNGKELASWRLWISGQDAAVFRDRIGFQSKFKQERLVTAGRLAARQGRFPQRDVRDFIERIELTQAPSMCIEVPGFHRFIQNGFDGGNSQGQSLDRVSVDLRRCFAPGQAYVAISRVRSLEGLNIERWDAARSFKSSKAFLTFMGNSYRAEPLPEGAARPAAQQNLFTRRRSNREVPVTFENVPRGVHATCTRCDATVFCNGTSDRSRRRCFMLLREQCKEGQRMYYVEAEQEPAGSE